MDDNQIYVFLLTLAAMLFIVNGTIYNRKWYNIVLGISLTGVVLLPHLDFSFFHYAFAVLFFLGSTIFILWFSKMMNRWIKISIGISIISALAAHFIFGFISLLAAEWIAFAIIALHYILESYKRSEEMAT